jgi:hypothetical protein
MSLSKEYWAMIFAQVDQVGDAEFADVVAALCGR